MVLLLYNFSNLYLMSVKQGWRSRRELIKLVIKLAPLHLFYQIYHHKKVEIILLTTPQETVSSIYAIFHTRKSKSQYWVFYHQISALQKLTVHCMVNIDADWTTLILYSRNLKSWYFSRIYVNAIIFVNIC